MVELGLPPRGTRLPTVLITRPVAQAQPDITQLAAQGIQALSLPLLTIEPASDRAAIRNAWADLPRCSLVMFASPNAVLHFFAAKPPSAQWPLALRAAATGPGTVAALLHAGVPAQQCIAPPGPRFDSQALWERKLQQQQTWRGARVLIVRGNGGRDELAGHLTAAGAEVVFVQSYSRAPPVWSAAQQALAQAAVQAPHAHLWHFSSSEAVRHLPALMPQARWGSAHAVATHPRIARAAREVGFGLVDEIEVPLPALVAFVRAQTF
jgi:uroporphyrinogen-III synthase